jgi:hypothetical protein
MIGKTSVIVASMLFSTVQADWKNWDLYSFKGVKSGDKDEGKAKLTYEKLGKDGEHDGDHDGDHDGHKKVEIDVKGVVEGNKKHGKADFVYKKEMDYKMDDKKDDKKDDDEDYYPEDDGEEDKERNEHDSDEWKQDFCEIACERTKECRMSKFGSYCKPGNTEHDPDVCFGLYRTKYRTGSKHRRYCFQPTDRRCNDRKLVPLKCHIKPRFTKFGGIIAFEKFLLNQDRS